MPYIQIETGHISKQQKEELIAGLTKVASDTLNVKPEHFYVLIKENDPDNWGVGGEMLSELFRKHPGF